MSKKMEWDLERYWQSIPIGEERAVHYPELCFLWDMKERKVRRILHELSLYDNKDNYILIRSGNKKGFYKTDDAATLERFKRECLAKGRSNFAPVKKINRVLADNGAQYSVFNNLKAERIARGIKQTEVVAYMRQFDPSFDAPTLSKLENEAFLPTPYQLRKMADFYGVEPRELVCMDLFAADIFGAI